jgi:hypothetical protein
MPISCVLIVSPTLQLPMLLNLYNQCQDINLTLSVYFTHSGRWHITPDQKIDADAAMQNRIELDSGQDILEGALVYRIQRRQHIESDRLKDIELLVTWHIDHAERSHIRALLVEHREEFNWNEDKLRELHQKCWQPLDAWINPIGSNWLSDDTSVLATTIKAANRGYRWDIFISKGEGDNVKRPLWIDAER